MQRFIIALNFNNTSNNNDSKKKKKENDYNQNIEIKKINK